MINRRPGQAEAPSRGQARPGKARPGQARQGKARQGSAPQAVLLVLIPWLVGGIVVRRPVQEDHNPRAQHAVDPLVGLLQRRLQEVPLPVGLLGAVVLAAQDNHLDRTGLELVPMPAPAPLHAAGRNSPSVPVVECVEPCSIATTYTP